MVYHLDVFKDDLPGLIPCEKAGPMDIFPLQGAPEGLHTEGLILTRCGGDEEYTSAEAEAPSPTVFSPLHLGIRQGCGTDL